MSRRHKENQVENTKPQQQAEPQGGGSLRGMRFSLSSASISKMLSSLMKTIEKPKSTNFDKVTDSILGAFRKGFKKKDVEIDDDWVKIRRKPLEDFLNSDVRELLREPEYCTMAPDPTIGKPKKGRSLLKRFIDKMEDSKVIGFFKTTYDKAKQKAKELYEGMTQFCVCFLNAIHVAYCPDDDPYGKISHYHRMLSSPEAEEAGIPVTDIPARRTISGKYCWFRDWRPAVTYEDGKARRERHKHSKWEELIQWIKAFLQELAPQYAVQPVYEVGI